MADAGARAEHVGLALEAVDPAHLRVDLDTGTVPPLMLWCVAALTQLSPEPSQVRLVVTGDFVGSVRARLGTDDGPVSFDLARGSGFVGGKTMPTPDGRIDVLTHASWFADPDDEPVRQVLEQLTKRTVVHEAQHVAMAQQHQGYVTPDDTGWRMTNLLSAADSVMGEYRAELGVGPGLRQGDLAWNALSVLGSLRSDLARVVADYQVHLDVGRLAYDVGTVGLVAWRSLAYMVAAGRVLADNEPVPVDVMADSLWERMAARRWGEFTEALGAGEPGTVRMERGELDAAIAHLAGVLGDWLGDLGFEWTDSADGASYFRITHWDLLDPAFVQVDDPSAET